MTKEEESDMRAVVKDLEEALLASEKRLERAYATMERWLEECRGCKFCSDAARELKEKK